MTDNFNPLDTIRTDSARRTPLGSVTKAGFANSPGDNVLHTPASGRRIRLHWIATSSSQDNVNENLVVMKFGAAGSEIGRWRMGTPGAFSHQYPVDGAADEPLIINLANANGIDWNVTLEEL